MNHQTLELQYSEGFYPALLLFLMALRSPQIYYIAHIFVLVCLVHKSVSKVSAHVSSLFYFVVNPSRRSFIKYLLVDDVVVVKGRHTRHKNSCRNLQTWDEMEEREHKAWKRSQNTIKQWLKQGEWHNKAQSIHLFTPPQQKAVMWFHYLDFSEVSEVTEPRNIQTSNKCNE